MVRKQISAYGDTGSVTLSRSARWTESKYQTNVLGSATQVRRHTFHHRRVWLRLLRLKAATALSPTESDPVNNQFSLTLERYLASPVPRSPLSPDGYTFRGLQTQRNILDIFTCPKNK